MTPAVEPICPSCGRSEALARSLGWDEPCGECVSVGEANEATVSLLAAAIATLPSSPRPYRAVRLGSYSVYRETEGSAGYRCHHVNGPEGCGGTAREIAARLFSFALPEMLAAYEEDARRVVGGGR